MFLIISEYYGEKDGPAGIVFEKVTKALLESDLDFVIISSGKSGNKKNIIKIKRHLIDLPIIRHYEDKIFTRKTCHPKVGSWGYRAKKLASSIIENNNISHILAWTNPISSLYVGVELSKKYKIPLIWRFDDPYPPYNYPRLKDHHMAVAYKNFEKNWLKENMPYIKAISSPSEELSNWMSEKLSISKPIINWPHIGGDDRVTLKVETKSLQKNSDKNSFNIAYLGRLSDNRDPRFLLKAIEYYKSKNINIQFHFFGSIHKNWKKDIEEGVKKNYVIRHRKVGFLDSLALMKQFDALVLLEAPFESGVFLPSKFCDYVWSKRPILISTPQNSVVENYVGKDYHGLIGYDTNTAIRGINNILINKVIDQKNPIKNTTFSKENIIKSINNLKSI